MYTIHGGKNSNNIPDIIYKYAMKHVNLFNIIEFIFVNVRVFVSVFFFCC